MLVKHTLDFDGNLLAVEILDEHAEPDLTDLINFHANKLVEMTLRRRREQEKGYSKGDIRGMYE